MRHEQAAAMMAHAWSIFGDHPGVCLVTAGPGYTNTLTGLVNAAFDNVPLVLISGTAPVRDWDRGALQEMNQSAMVRSVVKWSGVCHDIKRIPEYIAKAFRHAVAGRPGPVFLEFPPDILNIRVDGKRRHAYDLALDLVREKKVRLGEMITHRFPLDQYHAMIEVNRNKAANHAVKTVVSFM